MLRLAVHMAQPKIKLCLAELELRVGPAKRHPPFPPPSPYPCVSDPREVRPYVLLARKPPHLLCDDLRLLLDRAWGNLREDGAHVHKPIVKFLSQGWALERPALKPELPSAEFVGKLPTVAQTAERPARLPRHTVTN